MTHRNDWIYAFTLSVVISLATLIPYLLANRITEPLDITRFKINPLDGHSYLVKMRQDESGSRLFQLMYIPQVSDGTLTFICYLLLGHFAHWFGLPHFPMFHATRIVISVGMLLLAYLFFYLTVRTSLHSRDRLYLSWIFITALMLYAPLAFQRRLTLELFFLLAGYAALGLERIQASQNIPFMITALCFILVILLNLLVIGAGLRGVREAVVHQPGEIAAYQGLDENVPAGSGVLAIPDTGNRLPAYRNSRVLCGHPFETPHPEEEERTVRSFFKESNRITNDMERWTNQGITNVFYGLRERVLGHPKWLMELSEEYRFGEVQIFRVIQL